jgi:hypothetical protein
MGDIYNYIPSHDILNVHDYTKRDLTLTFTDVLFRTSNTNFHSFQAPLGLKDNKCISTTNKQLSFLPAKLQHFLGNEYASCLKTQYNTIRADTNIIIVDEPVYQFFDYESVSGTGHAYDLMFYLLFNYIQTNQKSKLLVVKSNNAWYNKLLDLIKEWYDVEYYVIEESITYRFLNFTCAQTYQNILFDDVKNFIYISLVNPIINKYDNMGFKYYDNIYKIKISNQHNTGRCNSDYILTDEFKSFTESNNYHSIDSYSEEEKIYILNKAKNIIITWGSSWYININYYTHALDNKYIYVIYHSNMMSEYNFLFETGTHIRQNMPSWASGGYTNQSYNTTLFSGKKLAIGSLSEIPLYMG